MYSYYVYITTGKITVKLEFLKIIIKNLYGASTFVPLFNDIF